MRVLITTLMSVLLLAAGVKGQDDHYFYRGKAIPMEVNTEFAYLVLQNISSEADVQHLIGDAKAIRGDKHFVGQTLLKVEGTTGLVEGRHWAEIQFPAPLSEEAYAKRLRELEGHPDVLIATPVYKDPWEDHVGVSELFHVKLKSADDMRTLQKVAGETKTTIVGRNKFMPTWYTLSCNKKSRGNALEMANYFYHTGKFVTAEPDRMVDLIESCVNDSAFFDQWGLENTGQECDSVGIDLNACAAWANWTTGDPNITVCILDQGVQMDHPDLINNVVGPGWDAQNGSSPQIIRGNHGTPCAGIAVAEQENNIGVSGVAPDCGLMSVSHPLSFHPMASQWAADGINWAWHNGADVISNSWGANSYQTMALDEAMDSAMTYGRNGLGTILCFATHNFNSAVIYPANYHPNIFAVGAASPNGERKNPSSCDGEFWGSNFGPELDFIAPGVKVATTDRTGSAGYAAGWYHENFNGTSAATPHVAGLVGLVLSMNPCLKLEQVADVIERTCQKVNTYPYAETPGRPNGTWHNEVGYGLVDMEAACRYTRELYLQNDTIDVDSTFQVAGTIFAGEMVTTEIPFGPFRIAAPATVDFRASTAINLAPGFSVDVGAVFTAVIFDASTCVQWDTSARLAPPLVAATEAPAQAEAYRATNPLVQHGLQAFPNPFRTATTVRMTVPRTEEVRLAVYDLHGKEVAELFAGKARADLPLERQFSADMAPEGIYIARLVTASGDVYHQKLLLKR